MGNCTQCSVITYKGKESEKEYIYIYIYTYTYTYIHIYAYITEALCCIPETNTTL